MSVAVIGLDAFRPACDQLDALAGWACQRILLADRNELEAAIAVVNAGLVQAVALVGGEDFASTLSSEIARARKTYFERLCAPYRLALRVNGIAFLDDPLVETVLATQKTRLGAVSHSVSANPPGVFIACENGRSAFLMVYDDAYAEVQAEIVREASPQDLVQGGFAEAGTDPAPWARLIADGTPLPGSRYRTCLVTDELAARAWRDGGFAPYTPLA